MLNIAQHCQLAPVLAEEYPHTTEEAEQGNAEDAEATADLLGGPPAKSPNARALVWWTRKNLAERVVKERVSLRVPGTGELVSPGTPDVAGYYLGSEDGEGLDPEVWTVVDWKKKEQYWAGLPGPDDNLQTHAYALAHVLSRGLPAYRVCLLLWGDGAVQEYWSRTYTVAEWTPIFEEIRNICAQPPPRDGIRPRGHSGPHCTGCYQRRNCGHWLLPAEHIGTELAPIASPGGLTAENAPRVYLAWERLGELYDRVETLLRDYADRQPIPIGENKEWGPHWQKGKRSASVADLERAGLSEHIRQGEPYRVYRLRTRR